MKVRLNLALLPPHNDDIASDMYDKPPYFDQVYIQDKLRDQAIRRTRFSRYEVNPRDYYNRSMLIHTSLISGRPGYDFSNPTAWIGRIRQQPRPSLQANYGGAMQSGRGIAANIAATSGYIRKSPGVGIG